MTRIAGLILAAGRGTRFGAEGKMLARLDGEPLVRHAARAALAGGLDPVLAVVGHRCEEVTSALGDVTTRTVDNPAFAEGLATSLRAGIAALGPEADGVVVLLGDMPRVTPDVIRALVARFERDRPAAVVPAFQGRRGNPVLLGAALFPAIGRLQGDTGAGPLLRERADVAELPWPDDSVLQDVDTPEALARLSRASGGAPRP